MIFDPEKSRPSRPTAEQLEENARGAWWMAHMPIDLIAHWLGICEEDAVMMRVWAQSDLRDVRALLQ